MKLSLKLTLFFIITGTAIILQNLCFSAGNLWQGPIGWNPSWWPGNCPGAQPSGQYPLPNTGALPSYLGFAGSALSPNINGNCPYVRVVNSYSAPNTAGALMTNMVGQYSTELFSSKGTLTGTSGNEWAKIQQTDIVPTGQFGGACLSVWYAADFDADHIGNAGGCRFQFEFIVGTTTFQNVFFYAFSPQSVSGQDGWYYKPWTNFISPCLPSGQMITIRFTAWACAYTDHYSFGWVDDPAWLTAGCCPSPTATRTCTYIASYTATATVIPTTQIAYAFPNPVNSTVNSEVIFVYDIREGDCWIEVYNMAGTKVAEVYDKDSNGNIEWDIRKVGMGVYCWRLVCGEQKKVWNKIGIIR